MAALRVLGVVPDYPRGARRALNASDSTEPLLVPRRLLIQQERTEVQNVQVARVFVMLADSEAQSALMGYLATA